MKKVAGFVLVISVALAVWGYSMWPREDTVFADRFDRRAFAQLPFGASMTEARRLVGAPLTERTFTLHERWIYCLADRQPITGKRRVLTMTAEIATEGCPVIEFDRTGRVVDVTGLPDSLKGFDAVAIRSSVGEPMVRRHGGKFTAWYYSKGRRENGSYEQVTLTFDERGRVVDKNVAFMAD